MLVEQYLLSLGAPPSRVGFNQMIVTIEYVIRHPEASYITKDVYPFVAKQFGTTSLCIDHNLRGLIDAIWRNGDAKALEELSLASGGYRPSTKAFVYAVARRLAAANLGQASGT